MSSAPITAFPADGPAVALRVSMKGGGLYNQVSTGQQRSIESVLKKLHSVAGTVTAPAPLTLVDYGCSQGKNSMLAFNAIVAGIRTRSAGSILVIHNDLPTNEWSTFFSAVSQSDGEEAAATTSDVFHVASGASFFNPLAPAGSVAFGFSGTAFHFLSRFVCPLEGSVSAEWARPEDRIKYAEQAASDWKRILELRATELCAGGKLFVLVPCRLPAVSNVVGVSEQFTASYFTRSVNSILRRMVDQGIVKEEEFRSINIPTYFRTERELCAPLDSKSVGLKLEHSEAMVVPCPYYQQFVKDGDRARFAATFTQANRAWSESSFFLGFGSRNRSDTQHILDEVYDRFEQQVLRDPECRGGDFVQWIGIISKPMDNAV